MPTNNLNPWGNSPLQAKIPNESTIFPGITKEAENKIFATAQKQGKNQYERNLIANDLYKEALKEQNSINFNNNRSEAKQQLFKKSTETKDKAQSNDLRTTERTAEVADMIRNYSKTNGYGDLDNWEDIDIINGFTNDNKQARNEIQDYINGDESAFSFSKRMGFGAGDNRSRFDMLTSGDGREWNDDILGHFETESYDNADNKVGTWFKNLGKSTYNLASDITNMVVNPVDTLNNLSKAAVGGAMNLVGLDDKLGDEGWLAEANKVADGMGDFLKDRYGGKEQILNTFYQDPAGLISDIASIVAGGAGLAKGGATAVAKTAATTGAKSVARNAGKVANVAGKVMRTANNLDPATMILKGEGKIAGGAYKGAKGVVNAVTSPIETGKKVLNSAGEGLDKIGEYGAKKITGTTSAQDKLYKAQEPRMNILTRKKDLEKRRVNSDRANELIVEYGYKPTDTASRLTAHEATMKKIWNEVEKRVNNDEAVGINQSQLAEKLYDYIKDQKKLGSSLNKADIAALEREMKTLNGKIVDLPTLEKKKQLYNSIINNWGESKVSDVFSNGLKVLTHEIGKIEDSILAEIPGEFQKLKNDFGALKDTYEDVFKADMKNQRKKGLGLIETYSRLEGLGDIASGVLSIFNGGAKDIAKGAGKLVMGKALAKARDVDFLVKEGFEDLYNTRKGLTENQVSSKTAKYQVADNLESEYETAVRNGDETRAKEILKQYGESKGYKGTEDYKGRGAWAAPSATVDKADFRNLEKIGEAVEDGYESNLYAVANGYSAMPLDMLDRQNTWRYFRNNTEREAYYPIREAMDEIQRQMKEYGEVKDMPKVTVYRAVPTYAKSIKKLQQDIDKFAIGEDGKPYLKGSLSQLSKDALESYDYYADMYKKYGGKPPVEELYEKLTNERDYKDSLSVKEGMLESGGEWVTPSKQYAREHGMNRFDGEYKIIKDEVPADQLWWDGNAIEERGFDDGNNYVVKKGAKNSRKNLEIEYDDKGNLIPLSKRFNENKADPRYQKYGTAGEGEKGLTAEEGLNLKNFKNGRTVQEIADNYGVKVDVVDKIFTPEGQKAYGMYGDKMITLAKDLKESTVPHELLHATFDMVDSVKKTQILNGIKKNLKVDDLGAEEWLADRFSEYYRTGKFLGENITKTLSEKIKQFFYNVKKVIDGTYANEKQIRQLFDDILDGKKMGDNVGGKSVFQSAGDIYGKNFKNWFGDWENDPKNASKVVNYKGEPLKVYHGSANKFTIFDKLKDGENTGNKGLYGNGFYFTDSLTTAKEYGKMGVDLPFSDYGNIADWDKAMMDKANIMEVYLDMKKPFYWKDIKNANQVRKLKEASGIRGLQWNDYLKEMRTLNDNQAVNFSKYLQNAGYDGIIYKGDNGTEYAVFKPTQIKSATDNIGTFDKNNPDIRYQTMHDEEFRKYKNKGLKEIGDGKYGKIYTGLKGNTAVAFLLGMEEGEVMGALDMKGTPVNLIWKGDGVGVSKIIRKHPEALWKIQKMIDERLESDLNHFQTDKVDNYVLEDPEGKVIVKVGWDGKNENMFVSAYDFKP